RGAPHRPAPRGPAGAPPGGWGPGGPPPRAPLGALDGLWDVMKADAGGLWTIQPATPGFLIATPAAVLVTLLTPAPGGEIAELFDQVNGPADARAAEAG
ncbi:MAG: hypothetical protein F4X76_00170, partial [Chloroflexi bacterium]|nr:hypothetical protein [Chloroflexota bacterium]